MMHPNNRQLVRRIARIVVEEGFDRKVSPLLAQIEAAKGLSNCLFARLRKSFN
jgi:protein-disulfide isomerase-like protein with CxxC motif